GGKVEDILFQTGNVDVGDVIAPIDAAYVKREDLLVLRRQRRPQGRRVAGVVARLDRRVRTVDVHIVEQQVERRPLHFQALPQLVHRADERQRPQQGAGGDQRVAKFPDQLAAVRGGIGPGPGAGGDGRAVLLLQRVFLEVVAADVVDGAELHRVVLAGSH